MASIETPSTPETPEEPQAALSAKAALDELAQWEGFALKRLGKGEQRPFAVEAIPDELAFELSAGLLAAGDQETVKSLFAEAKIQLIPDKSSPPLPRSELGEGRGERYFVTP